MQSGIVLLILAALCSGSSLVQAERRVKLGDSMTKQESPLIETPWSYDLKVHAIQEDQYLTGNILAAVGSAVYTVDEFGTFTLLAGSPGEPGYRMGWPTIARFNETAGIAQISSSELIVADKNNQCLRKIYRYDSDVETFAGTCNVNQIYTEESYKLWKTFNSPTTLHYDSSRLYLYVLDVMEAGVKSAIIYNNVYNQDGGDQGKITMSSQSGHLPTDFFYDSDAKTFFIAGEDKIATVKWSTYGLEKGSNIYMSGVHDVASRDDIIVGSHVDEGYIAVNDQQTGDAFKLCAASESYIVDCTLHKPTAVAVINDKLYVGTTKVTGSGFADLREVHAFLNIITFTIPSDSTTTTTADPFDDFTTWYSGYNYSYSYSLNGGVIAIIVIACILAVGLKVGLITWRVRRWSYRRRAFGRTTIVAVNSSTTTTVPYGRLQESGPPAGQFPTPPPYTPSMQYPPSAAPEGQQPPAVHHPPPGPANRY